MVSRQAWNRSSECVCADGVGHRSSLARLQVRLEHLLGTRMVLNELVAFSMLGPQKAALDPRSFTIATFALCGFANLSSIGIQIGGIGALGAESKRRNWRAWAFAPCSPEPWQI